MGPPTGLWRRRAFSRFLGRFIAPFIITDPTKSLALPDTLYTLTVPENRSASIPSEATGLQPSSSTGGTNSSITSRSRWRFENCGRHTGD